MDEEDEKKGKSALYESLVGGSLVLAGAATGSAPVAYAGLFLLGKGSINMGEAAEYVKEKIEDRKSYKVESEEMEEKELLMQLYSEIKAYESTLERGIDEEIKVRKERILGVAEDLGIKENIEVIVNGMEDRANLFRSELEEGKISKKDYSFVISTSAPDFDYFKRLVDLDKID